MLNDKFKKKWIAALRGGNWSQIIGDYSREGNKRCALGVAYEVTGGYSLVGFGVDVRLRNDIVDMNDLMQFTFDEIADYIEEHY